MNKNSLFLILGVAIGGGLVLGFARWQVAKTMPKSFFHKFRYLIGHLIAKRY